jgi:hypothetical protein
MHEGRQLVMHPDAERPRRTLRHRGDGGGRVLIELVPGDRIGAQKDPWDPLPISGMSGPITASQPPVRAAHDGQMSAFKLSPIKGTGNQDPTTSASGWREMASQSNGASSRCWSELDSGLGTACKDFSPAAQPRSLRGFAAGGQLVDLQVISSHPLGGKAAFETGPDLCPVQMRDSR